MVEQTNEGLAMSEVKAMIVAVWQDRGTKEMI